ncbi:MAG: T3SS effector HopA1 family protein [Myxococcaceae bacterium]
MKGWPEPALAKLVRRLEWDGRRGLRLSDGSPGWVPPGEAEAFLTEHLYRQYFCRWRPPRGELSQAPAFVARLAEAAEGASTWADGWEVTQAGAGWAFVTNGAIQVFVADREGLRPRGAGEGTRVQLRLPCAREAASPGFFFFVGRAGRLPEDRPHVRFYLNLTPDGAAGTLEALARGPAAAKLLLEAKFVNNPEGYGRVDTGILYVDPGSFDGTAALVRGLERSHPGWFRRGTPPFTCPLGKGSAVAEAPLTPPGEAAESYGESRCRLLARGLVRALRGGDLDWPARVAEVFALEGLSPERPWVKHLRAVQSPRGIRLLAPAPTGQGVGSPAMPRAARKKRQLPALSARLPLGAGGLKVSPFCLGMVDSPDAVPAAFDAGINFFFLSADMHWPLYEATRRGLAMLLSRGKAVRDQLVVCATAYVTQPEFCELPFREVLEAVPGLGRLDVVSAGGSYWHDFWPRLEVYQEHRRSGLCGARAIGTSFHDRSAALTAIAHDLVDIAFIRYNAGHAGAQRDLFPHLPPSRRTRIFNFKSTSAWVTPSRAAELGVPSRYWVPRHTDHYRFALTRPEVDGVLLSLDSAQQVRELADALAEGPLDPAQETYLMELAALNEGQK